MPNIFRKYKTKGEFRHKPVFKMLLNIKSKKKQAINSFHMCAVEVRFYVWVHLLIFELSISSNDGKILCVPLDALFSFVQLSVLSFKSQNTSSKCFAMAAKIMVDHKESADRYICQWLGSK